MTIVYADRVLETTSSTGTGTINLAGPVTGWRSFVSAGLDGKKVPYFLVNGNDWESGVGTVTDGTPDTLSRDTILASSNSGAALSLSGTTNVYLGPIGKVTMNRDEGLNFTDLLGTGGGTANAHTVTMPVTPLSYTDGMFIMYRATVANTGAMTVNVNSMGAKSLKIRGSDPTNGQIPSGTLVAAVYKASNNTFEAITPHARVTTSGAYDATLTLTGATNVTLPTSGTVATLAGSEALTNKSVNGVTLTTGGSATNFLNETGSYTAISSGTGVSSEPLFVGYRDAGNVSATNIVICNKETTNRPTGSKPYNTTTGIFTCPADGDYVFTFSSVIGAGSKIAVYKNGTYYKGLANGSWSMCLSLIIPCVAGDTLAAWVTTGSVNATQEDYNTVTIRRIKS